MAQLIPYLTFNGNCKQAMTFYEKCFGGKLELMTFGSIPDGKAGPDVKDKIIHSALTAGAFFLMASDGMPGKPANVGNNVHLSVNCASDEEIEKLFRSVGENGTVTMDLHIAFWGARFGMLTDQFGIHWMFNREQK